MTNSVFDDDVPVRNLQRQKASVRLRLSERDRRAQRAERLHTLAAPYRRVETLFIRRRTAHEDTALRSFVACLKTGGLTVAA